MPATRLSEASGTPSIGLGYAVLSGYHVPLYGLFAEVEMKIFKVFLSSFALVSGSAVAMAEQRTSVPPPPPIGVDSGGMFYVTYPRASVARGEEGASHYRVTIDQQGRPVDCIVTRSSGYERLDQRTCRAVINHTRFILPPNPTGSTIPPYYEGRVDWRLR